MHVPKHCIATTAFTWVKNNNNSALFFWINGNRKTTKTMVDCVPAVLDTCRVLLFFWERFTVMKWFSNKVLPWKPNNQASWVDCELAPEPVQHLVPIWWKRSSRDKVKKWKERAFCLIFAPKFEAYSDLMVLHGSKYVALCCFCLGMPHERKNIDAISFTYVQCHQIW